jgi:hypothetical protein
MTATIGPFVGHYHDGTYCGACATCSKELTLLASHGKDGCFMLALCETCDAPAVARMWGES